MRQRAVHIYCKYTSSITSAITTTTESSCFVSQCAVYSGLPLIQEPTKSSQQLGQLSLKDSTAGADDVDLGALVFLPAVFSRCKQASESVLVARGNDAPRLFLIVVELVKLSLSGLRVLR